MKVKRDAKSLGITTDFLVVNCKQQGLTRCRICGEHSLIVIASHSHQLRWCSRCVGNVTLTAFEDAAGKPRSSQREITKWVDNGSVQLIETPGTTLIITFRERPSLNAGKAC